MDRRPRHNEALIEYIERVICGWPPRKCAMAEIFYGLYGRPQYIEPSFVINPAWKVDHGIR